ncbi:EF-hand domain-containing protein [Roseicella aquatilis]|uniref:EF-hand domain-containing protein n=1 Tax=Roseicella aquatilis TaxID=2527868 RepID=A0A4R4D6A1_9PROT|nr:hypothetical protein [Roseicella aquatilis]TCZ53389.1 hypothetical protein EXY23_24955 [Roseicella aquatilis]
MKTFRMALLGAALAAAAAPALAQTAPAPGPDNRGPRAGRGPGAILDRIDGNKDGKATWDETWIFVQDRFTAADADRDGRLTQQEMGAARLGPGLDGRERGASPEQRTRVVGMIFRGIDANRDGVVVIEEVRPLAEARFRALDANGDGAVTRDEMPAPRQRHQGRHG